MACLSFLLFVTDIINQKLGHTYFNINLIVFTVVHWAKKIGSRTYLYEMKMKAKEFSDSPGPHACNWSYMCKHKIWVWSFGLWWQLIFIVSIHGPLKKKWIPGYDTEKTICLHDMYQDRFLVIAHFAKNSEHTETGSHDLILKKYQNAFQGIVWQWEKLNMF